MAERQNFQQMLVSLYQTGAHPLVLDARPEELYLHQRLSGSVNVPLLDFTSRCYLLPDKGTAFAVVVPSRQQFVVVADQSQHGAAMQGGSTAVYIKGTVSLEEFLSSRGWGNVTCYLPDVPELWAAAGHLSVLEQGLPADPHQLARRCLFAPSGLLADSIASVEAAVLAQQAPAPQHDGCCVLRALDVGCGSGRDVAWLASRQATVAASPTSHRQQLQHKSSAECHPQQQPPHNTGRVRWHVTGLDEWLGALERAADLAQAMQLTQQHTDFVYAKVCSETGELQQLQVPNKSRLSKTCWAAAPQHSQVQPAGTSNFGKDITASNSFDLIICCRFLVRALFPKLHNLLKPGGFILYCTFLDLPGVRAFGRPAGPDHLLQPGELTRQHFGPEHGFTVVRDDVVVSPDGREVCWFVAQKGTS